MKSNFLKSVCTLGPIGYFPASGTFATIFCLPIIFGLSFLLSGVCYLMVASFVTILSLASIHFSLSFFHEKDPSEIVIDEVAGIFLTFIFIKITFWNLILGAVLFRFFDIFKPLGIKIFERIPGSVGIWLDDVVAGFYSSILLLFIIFFTNV